MLYRGWNEHHILRMFYLMIPLKLFIVQFIHVVSNTESDSFWTFDHVLLNFVTWFSGIVSGTQDTYPVEFAWKIFSHPSRVSLSVFTLQSLFLLEWGSFSCSKLKFATFRIRVHRLVKTVLSLFASNHKLCQNCLLCDYVTTFSLPANSHT